MKLYLDANAHLPMCKKAVDAFVNFNNSKAGHGHAMTPSAPGRLAASALEQSRERIAQLIGAGSNQIFFTSTCTQACEWGLNILSMFTDSVNITPMEHTAVKEPAEKLFHCDFIPVDENGRIRNYYFDNSSVISIHVQNELGTVLPIEKYNCKYLFSDMSQSLGKLDIKLSSLPVDVAVFSAHKFGGPASVGFLYLKDTTWWGEFGTGSRYYFDRSGTPDVASVVACQAALEKAIATIEERYERMIDFRNVLEPGLEELGIEIIGKEVSRCPNTTFVRVGKNLAPHLIFQLGEKGIHVGLGSACGSLNTGASPIMTALGKPGSAHDYLRISQFGEYSAKEATYFLSKLRAIYPKGGDVA